MFTLKKFTKILCSAAVISGLALSQGITAFATPVPLFPGDVDLNGNITITDATEIQKYLAGTADLSKKQIYTADADGDGKVTVLDATQIQKMLAGLVEGYDGPYSLPYIISHNVFAENLSASYDSGKAMAGTPVTFTAEAAGGVAPFSYEFAVNGEVVQERSENNALTYTFENAGSYEISVKYYNVFDEYDSYTAEYAVVEPYESENPVISAVYPDRLYISFGESGLKITANAIFGAQPYEYAFKLDKGQLEQDFSDSNEFVIDSFLTTGEHSVEVTVKDADGNTAAETYIFEAKEPIID